MRKFIAYCRKNTVLSPAPHAVHLPAFIWSEKWPSVSQSPPSTRKEESSLVTAVGAPRRWASRLCVRWGSSSPPGMPRRLWGSSGEAQTCNLPPSGESGGRWARGWKECQRVEPSTHHRNEAWRCLVGRLNAGPQTRRSPAGTSSFPLFPDYSLNCGLPFGGLLGRVSQSRQLLGMPPIITALKAIWTAA